MSIEKIVSSAGQSLEAAAASLGKKVPTPTSDKLLSEIPTLPPKLNGLDALANVNKAAVQPCPVSKIESCPTAPIRPSTPTLYGFVDGDPIDRTADKIFKNTVPVNEFSDKHKDLLNKIELGKDAERQLAELKEREINSEDSLAYIMARKVIFDRIEEGKEAARRLDELLNPPLPTMPPMF